MAINSFSCSFHVHATLSRESLHNYKISFDAFSPQPTFFLCPRLRERIVCNKNTKTKNRNTNKREQHETRERGKNENFYTKRAKKVHVCLHVQRLWCVSTFTLAIQPQTVFSLLDAFERYLIRWVWSQIEGRINSYKDKAVLMCQDILKMKIFSTRNFQSQNSMRYLKSVYTSSSLSVADKWRINLAEITKISHVKSRRLETESHLKFHPLENYWQNLIPLKRLSVTFSRVAEFSKPIIDINIKPC